MKRIFLIMFLILAIISGCSQQKLSFGEVDKVPKRISEAIDSDAPLQMINRSGKKYYIVFNSQDEVESELETIGTTALVKLDEVVSKIEGVKQYVYYLTTDEYHDTIDIKVNGESMSYPVIIID